MSTAQSQQIEDVSFEEAMDRLEEIVSSMEGERMPLEDMVRSYEEGARLLRTCRQRIDSARQRVELISANLDAPAEKATLLPFDPATAEAADATGSKTRSAVAPAAAPAPRRKPTPAVEPEDDDIRLF
jgi:exodeoxyribonuclease VII small subunit